MAIAVLAERPYRYDNMTDNKPVRNRLAHKRARDVITAQLIGVS